ncbi:MAG: hypothetical protein BWK78_09680 [Thiotrichaceae bacterium IS1]|nr:MAG: hypothetical protein BWK78_09680 [Thiotrichaceae bacterium IS1]
MFKGHYAIVKYFYNIIISGYTSPYLDVSQTNGTINPFLDFPNWLVSLPLPEPSRGGLLSNQSSFEGEFICITRLSSF